MSLSIAAPVKANLKVVQGASLTRAWRWVQATDQGIPVVDENGDPVPVDLTDYRATAQIRTEAGGELLLDLDEFLAIDGTAGRVTLSIGRPGTLRLLAGGVWDLFLIHKTDDADAVCFLEGSVSLRPAVTVDD